MVKKWQEFKKNVKKTSFICGFTASAQIGRQATRHTSKHIHITPWRQELRCWRSARCGTIYRSLFMTARRIFPGVANWCYSILMKLFRTTNVDVIEECRLLPSEMLPGPLWKSLIALFSMLNLVYGTNSPLIFASLVRHSLLHFHLSHMAVHHHLHHLHDHHLHLLLLVQCFTLNLRLGSYGKSFPP